MYTGTALEKRVTHHPPYTVVSCMGRGTERPSSGCLRTEDAKCHQRLTCAVNHAEPYSWMAEEGRPLSSESALSRTHGK